MKPDTYTGPITAADLSTARMAALRANDLVASHVLIEILSTIDSIRVDGARVIRNLRALDERLNGPAGIDSGFNSLGEIQGSGLDIDRALARLATLREILFQIPVYRNGCRCEVCRGRNDDPAAIHGRGQKT